MNKGWKKPEVKIGIIALILGTLIGLLSIPWSNYFGSQQNDLKTQDTAESLIEVGMGQFDRGSYLEAYGSFDRARQVDPLSDTAWTMEGRSLQELAAKKEEQGRGMEAGQLKAQAVDLFTRALNINENNIQALYGKGYIFLDWHLYPYAIQDLELGMKNVPTETRNWGLLKGLARGYSEWGMADEYGRETATHNFTRCDKGMEYALILLNEDKILDDRPYVYEAMYLAEKCKDNKEEMQKWFDKMQHAS